MGIKKERKNICTFEHVQPRQVVPDLGKAVFRVADFDSPPVASSYQTDETQQVGERPGHVGGVVTSGKASRTNR